MYRNKQKNDPPSLPSAPPSFPSVSPPPVPYAPQCHPSKQAAKQGRGTELENGEGGAENVEKSRVVVVSNRLPISAQRDLETGTWTFRMSSGGLVTALQGVRHEMDFLWIGWMGVEVAESERVS